MTIDQVGEFIFHCNCGSPKTILTHRSVEGHLPSKSRKRLSTTTTAITELQLKNVKISGSPEDDDARLLLQCNCQHRTGHKNVGRKIKGHY